MNSKELLVRELNTTAKTIEWAISCVPASRLLKEPPHDKHAKFDHGFKTYFGRWSAYRHLFHLAHYEEFYALPTMRHWLGDPCPKVDLMFPEMEQEETRWKSESEKSADLAALLQRFSSMREEQIEVTRSIAQEVWREERVSTQLGMVSAEVVVMKTIEHTLVHGKAILRNALYWDRALEWLDSRG